MEMSTETLPQGTLRVALDGRLDTVGVDRIETKFSAAVAAGGHDAIIDLAAVTFVSSMGIRLIISAAKAQRLRGHRMVLYAASPDVTRTLDMVALDQIVPIVGDEQQALAALRAT